MKLVLKKFFSENKYIILLIMMLFIGCFVRLLQFGNVPGGINQDEAYAGYEAYSILHSGIDSWGYHFPVYFVSWGSGMNVLNSYLMIPFVAVFGLHSWVIRLPQVIVACCSLLVFFKLIKTLFSTKLAFFALFLLVINPWHIILSRWGLESNLAPGFLLFGLYFFILGLNKSRYFILSSLFYGLSLYCYATIWVIVPVIVLAQIIYAIITKKISLNRNTIISASLLFLLALPLLLFLAVNKDIIPEIRTNVFSVPKLLYMRDGSVSLSNISANLKTLFKLLWTQNDGLYSNTTDKFGLYYKLSFPFIIIGFISIIITTVTDFKKKQFSGGFIILIQLLCALLVGVLTEINVNRINCIHIYIIVCIAFGFYTPICLLKKHSKYWFTAIILLYSIFFLQFSHFYFTEYKSNIGYYFSDGIEDAVKFAETVKGNNTQIIVDSDYIYSKILFCSKINTHDYLDTVRFVNYPSAYLNASSFGRYSFGVNSISKDNVYIISKIHAVPNEKMLTSHGLTIQYFGTVAVAY